MARSPLRRTFLNASSAVRFTVPLRVAITRKPLDFPFGMVSTDLDGLVWLELHQIHHRGAFGDTARIRDLVHLELEDAPAIGEEEHVVVGVR